MRKCCCFYGPSLFVVVVVVVVVLCCFVFIRIRILVYSVMGGHHTLTVALEKERERVYQSPSMFFVLETFLLNVNFWSVNNSSAESHHREYNNRGQFTSGKSPPRIQ